MATYTIDVDDALVPGLTWLLAQQSALAMEPLADERAYVEMAVNSMATVALDQARTAAIWDAGTTAVDKLGAADMVASVVAVRAKG